MSSTLSSKDLEQGQLTQQTPSSEQTPSQHHASTTITEPSPTTTANDTIGPPPPSSSNPFSSPLQESLFIALIGLSQLFSVGGLGNTAFSVQHIGRALGTTSNGQLSWFLSSYALAGGVFVLVTGRLGDHFGHKRVFAFGWAWMALWSLVSGFAHNIVLFDVARAMTGVGNACLVPNSFALLGRAFEPFSVKKNIAFAFLGFCAPAGYIFGGVVGASFAQRVTWRWGYWFWALGSLGLGVATLVVVPERVGSPLPGLRLKRFDFVGTGLGVTGLTLFAFAWNQAAVVGWEEAYTYALLIVGVAFTAAFAVSQSYVSAPILPNSLWTRKGFLPIVSAVCFGWMSFGVFLYYTTVYILTVRMESPLSAVAEMVPLVIGGLFATASVGIFIQKVRAQYIFGVSMFSFFIGNVLMSFVDHSSSYWAFIFPACLLVVGGPDLSFASSSILISNAVLPEEQGVAGSFIATVVQYSIAIGLGIAATVEAHVNKGGRDIVLGYRGAWWLGIGFATVAFFIVVIFVRDTRFDGEKTAEKGSHMDVDGEEAAAVSNGHI